MRIWGYNLPDLLNLWGNPRTLIKIYKKLLPDDHYKDDPILKDKQIHGAVLGNLGNAYSDLGEPRKAIEFLKESLAIGKAIENPRLISFCEQKLKDLEGSEDNKTSNDPPVSNNPPASNNFLRTLFNKLKSKK
jgi:tetratricopeptide (TPR) repeat protein